MELRKSARTALIYITLLGVRDKKGVMARRSGATPQEISGQKMD